MNQEFSWKQAFSPWHLAVIFGAFLLDWGTKVLVIEKISDTTRISLGPFLNLIHTKNKGAAFGMFANASDTFRLFFFGLVTIVCLAFLVFSLGTCSPRDRLFRWGMALILGGALGNVKDRVLEGEVTDFIDFFVGNWHWPAFNVADSAITIGVCIIFYGAFADYWKKRQGRAA